MAGTNSMDIFFCYRKTSLHMQADKAGLTNIPGPAQVQTGGSHMQV